MECKSQKIDPFRDYIQQYQQFHAVLRVYQNSNSISMKLSNLNLAGVNSERMANSCSLRSSISFHTKRREDQEIIYSRIKIQYYRIALACKRVRRRRGKSVAEKIFCSVMPCSADLIL